MPVTADDLATSVELVADALHSAVDADWSAPAGTLEWNCARTADHLGRCLVRYASQLAVRPEDRYVGFAAAADDDAGPAALADFVRAGGRILATMARASPPDVRAFHPSGVSDAEGFAGMGCVETLVHGHDVAAGLGLDLAVPGDVCARVMARMFPHRATGLADVDPWLALRYVTGRTDLPGRPAVTTWRWRGAPLDG